MEAEAVLSDDVRNRIAQTAIKLFGKKGYAATSIREIVQQANTTKPMVYYYFGSKEGLYSSIVKHEFAMLAAALEEVAKNAASLEEGLRSFVVTYLRFFLSRGHAVSIIYKEMFGLGEGLLADASSIYYTRVKNCLINLFNLGASKLRLHSADLEASSMAILGILNMFLLRRMMAGQKFEIRPVIDQVMKVYLPGLRRFSKRKGVPEPT